MKLMRLRFAYCFAWLLAVAGNSSAFDGVVQPVAVTSSFAFFGPGQSGSSFNRFWNRSNTPTNTKYDVNRDGTVVFEGTINSGNHGVWSSSVGGSPELLISRFDSFDSDVFGNDFPITLVDVDYPQINDLGEVVFRATDNSGRLGIWELDRTTTNRSATPRALSNTDGSRGPQLGAGVLFSAYGFETPDFSYAFNNQSRIAFSGRIGSTNGVWRQDGQDSPEPLLPDVSDGPFGPGLGPNIDFGILGPLRVNEAGDVLVFSTAGDSESQGVWRVSAKGTNRELIVANDRSIDRASPYGFDFDRAEVVGSDEQGNAALLLTSKINTFSNDFVGIGFAPVGKPAVQVAVNRTDGVGGPGLGPGVEFGFSEFDPFTHAVVVNDNLAFVAPVDGTRAGVWIADADGNLDVVAVEPRVLTQVDVPRIEGLGLAYLKLTSGGDLVFLAGGQLWQYADGQLTGLIEFGSELDLSQAGNTDIRSILEVESFDLHESGWVAAQVRLTGNERALVRLNVSAIPEPSSLAVLSSFGLLALLSRRKLSRF